MGDTGLEPVTSCVSSMHSCSNTGFLAPKTAILGTKMRVFQSAVVALHWRDGGLALALGGNRH